MYFPVQLAVTLRGADGEQLSAHAHCFFRLEVDGEVIRNAEINVTEISLNDADFVLGIDFVESTENCAPVSDRELILRPSQGRAPIPPRSRPAPVQ